MTAAASFGRVVTAMVTPFDDEGRVDHQAAGDLARRLVDDGHDGLLVNGTTGESPTTSDDEKLDLLRTVLTAVGDRARVTAGAGSNDTAHTVELARAAEGAGAHGLLVVTPYYSKPPQEGIAVHFRSVADAVGVPLMLYDIPGRAGVPIHTETLVRLGEHPRIVAVKDAKADLYETAWVHARSDLAVYSGDDALNLPQLALGAAGLVSVVGHVAGAQHRAMLSAVDTGDLPTARGIARQLLPAVRGIMTRTQGAIMAKAALELLGVLGNRVMRPPLPAATEEQVRLLAEDLHEAGLL